jgi:hypothetical protein
MKHINKNFKKTSELHSVDRTVDFFLPLFSLHGRKLRLLGIYGQKPLRVQAYMDNITCRHAGSFAFLDPQILTCLELIYGLSIPKHSSSTHHVNEGNDKLSASFEDPAMALATCMQAYRHAVYT